MTDASRKSKWHAFLAMPYLRIWFPILIMLPVTFYYGRVLSRTEPWGLGAWTIVYLPFVAMSLLSNALIARYLNKTLVLRTILYFILPFFFYGVFIGVRVVVVNDQLGLSDLPDKVAVGATTMTVAGYAVLSDAPYILGLLGLADYFVVSRASRPKS